LVVKLAQAASNDHIVPGGTLDPVRLGVLADALEDAGAPGEPGSSTLVPSSAATWATRVRAAG